MFIWAEPDYSSRLNSNIEEFKQEFLDQCEKLGIANHKIIDFSKCKENWKLLMQSL